MRDPARRTASPVHEEVPYEKYGLGKTPPLNDARHQDTEFHSYHTA